MEETLGLSGIVLHVLGFEQLQGDETLQDAWQCRH